MSLLTISQPTKTEFGSSRYLHDFSPRFSLAKSRLSPKPFRVDSPVNSLRASVPPSDDKMSGLHRGLPPPSSMLPEPSRQGPPASLSQSLGPMPEPPRQWHGQEEPMRNWLAAKAEEEKRKQEEEKTRQESLRLERRRIEQSMLRESLQGGVPPAMVPAIYAGIGGGDLTNAGLEWLQQYAAQLQAAQQQVMPQASPDARRDVRVLPPGSSYGVANPIQQQVVPSQPAEEMQASAPLHTTFSAYAPPRHAPTSAPRSATHTQLPRLTTNEMYVHTPAQQGPGSAHPLQQSQTIQQDQPLSSPAISFHHWVPPSESKGGNLPQTPASKGEPHSAHPGSQLSEPEYKDSPRKRKAQGGHERNPPPTASPPFPSLYSSVGRKGGHARSRSNASTGRDSDSRPDSRREMDPPRSSQPEPFAMRPQDDAQPGAPLPAASSEEDSRGRPTSSSRRPGLS